LRVFNIFFLEDYNFLVNIFANQKNIEKILFMIILIIKYNLLNFLMKS